MLKIKNLLDFFFPKLSISGGGGGGGASTGTQTMINELPTWARGYAKSTLEKTAALSDKPYQTYGGDRIAGFSDLQKQAQAAAGPEGFQRTVGQYMSPYQQNVTDIQKQEAARQSGIAGTQQAAQATQAGAFGGGRDAIMRAERERNLGRQMNEIQAVGSQNAYNNATQQYNTGLQQMSAFGGQQQALRQQGLSQAYQDFQNQQNYPYKQLGFMSDMIRGLPVGQSSTKTMYEPDPSMAQNLAAAGTAAYGLSKFMAEGGMAYADGGSVDSQDNVSRIVSKLSDEQLQQAAQAAQARGDTDQLEAIQSEMAMRASERNGLASAVTPDMANQMTAANGGLMGSYAGGGVVAFDDGGVTEESRDVVGIPNQAALKEWMDAQKAIKEFTPREAMTLKDRDMLDKANFERFQKFAGEDPYAPMAEKFKKFEEDRVKNYEQGKGLAALQAIPALLRPGSKSRAFGEAAGQIGSGLSALAKADAAEKRALSSMEFNLADAQRKERMGLTKSAIESTTEAQKDQIAADKAKLEALKARAKGATDAGRAFRTTGSGGAGKGPKIAEQLAAAEVAYEKNPTDETLKQVTALRRAVDRTRTTDVGTQKAALAREAILSGENAKVQAAMNKFMYNPKFLEADAKGTADIVWKEELEKQRSLFSAPGDNVNKNSSNSGKLKFDAQGNPI
jgi:hypothetical protein